MVNMNMNWTPRLEVSFGVNSFVWVTSLYDLMPAITEQIEAFDRQPDVDTLMDLYQAIESYGDAIVVPDAILNEGISSSEFKEAFVYLFLSKAKETPEYWIYQLENLYPASSRLGDMMDHPHYRRLVYMGDKAYSAVLKRMETRPSWLVVVLQDITGANPVREESRGHLDLVIEDWKAYQKSQSIQLGE